MQPPSEAQLRITEAEALIAQALCSLEGAEDDLVQRQADAGGQMSEQLKAEQEEDMHRQVLEQLSLAMQRPPFPAEEIPPDPATVFARRVRRRRAAV